MNRPRIDCESLKPPATKDREQLFVFCSKQFSLFSLKQLEELEGRIKFLKQSFEQPSKGIDERREHSLFYDALVQKLERFQGTVYPPFEVYKKKPEFKNLIKKFEEAFNFLILFYKELVKPMKMSKKNLQIGYYLYAGLMIEELRQWNNYTLSFTGLLTNFRNFPAIFDRAYPGYFENGFGKVLFSDVDTSIKDSNKVYVENLMEVKISNPSISDPHAD